MADPFRILIADDSEFNRQITAKTLRDFGYAVAVARDGLETVEKVKSESFDLVLIDCHMPLLNGFDATRQIRALNISVPIIALTGEAMLSSDELAEVGLSGYLTKPLDVDTLINTIETLQVKKTD